jgi:hypothetical protein
LRTEEITTARDWEANVQVDCGKMHDLVSKRGGSRCIAERAGSHEAMRGRARSGHDP